MLSEEDKLLILQICKRAGVGIVRELVDSQLVIEFENNLALASKQTIQQTNPPAVTQASSESDKIALFIYILLGLRGSEVCGLEWSDIDFETKKLSVNRNHGYYGKRFGSRDKQPKSKTSKRTISMPSQLIEILQEYKIWWDNEKINRGDLWEQTDKLMTTDNGKTRVSNTLSLWLKQAQAEYGLRHISPHLLRHTNITLQIIGGVPLKTVSERAGHSDVGITMEIYTHSLKKKEIEAADIIDNIFCRKVKTASI